MSTSFVARKTLFTENLDGSKGVKKGCILNTQDNAITSSGIPSFDKLFNDGIPVGSIVCIREDLPRSTSNFASSLLKCFIAEGLEAKHEVLYFDAVDSDCSGLLNSLPSLAKSTTQDEQPSPSTFQINNESDFKPNSYSSSSLSQQDKLPKEKMTIAWRYKHLAAYDDAMIPTNSVGNGAQPLNKLEYRCFDLGKASKRAENNNANIQAISIFDKDYESKFLACLEELCIRAKSEKTLLRIAIRAFGSPLMLGTNLAILLYKTRRIMQKYTDSCILFFSMPSQIYKSEPKKLADVESQCDLVVELQSFVGTPKETAKAFAEYSGFLKIIKPLRNPGTLSLALPETADLAFKTKRRQLIFEPFHIPPDHGDISSTSLPAASSSPSSSICSSSSRNDKLDF